MEEYDNKSSQDNDKLWNEQNFIIRAETDKTFSTCICVILKNSAHYKQMTYHY